MNKSKKGESQTNIKMKSGKSTMNSKYSNPNSQSNAFGINTTIKSNGMALNATYQTSSNNNSNIFTNLPPEMKTTFEKLVSQLDLVIKTIKIFDQRIQNIEGHISTLYNRRKKGFVQKQPPQMGDYQYLLENSNNFMPNNSLNNNTSQINLETNNFHYYTPEINNPNFKETMNINDENKKNVFKTEIDINNQNNQNQGNEEDNKYKGQIQEEYEYNGIQGEEGFNQNQNQYNQENEFDNEHEFEQEGEEYMNEQEYEQEGEEYMNEQEYEQEGDQEGEGEGEGEEEQPAYDYNNEEMNDGNNDINKSK
jgi:hypothetical protein